MNTELRERITETQGFNNVKKVLWSAFQNITFLKSVTIIFAFLLGRASISENILPFGLSIYCAATTMSKSKIGIAVAVSLGMLSNGGFEQLYITLAAMFLYTIISLVLQPKGKFAIFSYSLYGLISSLIPGIVMSGLQGFLLYDTLRAIFQSFIVFTLTFVFEYALKVLKEFDRRQMFSTEETISFLIFLSVAVIGVGNIGVLGFSFKNIILILLVMITAYKCGPGTGSAVGICVGLISGMSMSEAPLIIGVFGLCGLLAGIFKSLGKPGSSLGFLMGIIVMSIYIGNTGTAFTYLSDTIAAVLLFLITPNKFTNRLWSKFSKVEESEVGSSRDYSLRMKEITIEKLNKFAKAFEEMAKTFGQIAETKTVTEKQEITDLFDRVAEKVCKDCSLCMHCWDRNFYNTYQAIFKIICRLEEKGVIERGDIPVYFIGRCERINEFVDAINNYYQIFKVNMVWKSRVGESRGLVSQQLNGLSKIIENLATEIDIDVHLRSDVEDLLVLELSKAGISGCEAVVYENKQGKYEISVYHRDCKGHKNCSLNIEKVVSKVTGRKMTKTDVECENTGHGDRFVLRLVEEECFKVLTGVASTCKYQSDVSGDCYSFLNAGNGKYLLAISDGVGSGRKAALQSSSAINLLEQFTECGFDKDTSIKLINSVLVLKSNDDSFATIDMSVLDLYSGEAEFVKVGAAPTFIKNRDKVEIVRAISLPAGLMSIIDAELAVRKIEPGSFIVMVTDGVIDAYGQDGNGEREFADFLASQDIYNPQQIADKALKRACELSQDSPLDDMTVLVGKVWKKTT